MKTNRTVPRLLFATALILAIAGGGYLAVRAQSPTSAPPTSHSGGPTLQVDSLPVRPLAVQQENALSGQVEPSHIATIAAEVANRIVSRPVQQGDPVAQGAVLFTLDSEAAQTALRQAQDSYAQAVAARQQLETDYQRALVETDANREQARAQLNQSIADAQRVRAQYTQATAGERKTHTFTRAQELRQAEDALAQARSDERLAKIEFDRYTYLVREGAAPQQTLDRAQSTLEQSTAHRQSMEQALSLAKEGSRQEDREAASAQVQAASAQIDVAAHQVDAARAALRIAETRDTRLAALRRQIEGLRAQEAQAQDAVRQAQIAVEKRTVRAPFAGRVLATLADAGDMTSPGGPLIRLGAIATVKVTFAVPEASRPALRLHQTVTVTADALPGQAFSGRITSLGFQADPKSRTFPIEVTVHNASERLLPNMVARLRLTVGVSKSRLLIPASAVSSEDGAPCVFILRDGIAIRREVTLGAPVGDDVEVTSGLSATDHVAATPQRLTDGAAVTVRTPATEGARS